MVCIFIKTEIGFKIFAQLTHAINEVAEMELLLLLFLLVFLLLLPSKLQRLLNCKLLRFSFLVDFLLFNHIQQ